MSKIDVKPIKVQLNGKATGVRGLYHIAESTTMVSALDLAKILGGFQVKGLGNAINVITDAKVVKEEKPYLPLKGRRIAVSAPHKKNANRSTKVPSYYEGNVMFEVACELTKMLRAAGAEVLQVRDKIDQVYTLTQRTNKINAFHPDLMIEIHSDASSGARGVYVIAQRLKKTHKLNQMLIDEICKATGLPKHPRGIFTRTFTSNGKVWDYYHMNRESNCLAIMVECGDHTNQKDSEYLSKPTSPKQIATGAFNAIKRYFA